MIRNAIATLLILPLLCACGRSDWFEVSGRLENNPMQELTMVFYNGAAIQQVNVRTDDEGRFDLRAESPRTVMVDLLDEQGNTLARFAAQNGDKVKVNLHKDDPIPDLSGNKINRDLTYIRRNHPDPDERDRAIEKLITDEPALLSTTVIFMELYRWRLQPERADSLFNSLLPEARPLQLVENFGEELGSMVLTLTEPDQRALTLRGPDPEGADSVFTFAPSAASYSLLAYTTASRPDSIGRALARARRDHSDRHLQVVEVVLTADRNSWANASRSSDSITWRRGWLPGGTRAKGLDRRNLSRLPWFILTDSTGHIIHQGPYPSAAIARIP